MQVSKNKIVSIRYIMRNSKAEILENNMSGNAICYLHGSENILTVLQQQLEGLQKGEQAMVYLPAANSKLADDFSFDVVVDDVREALKEELLLGYPVQHATQHCPDNCICYMEQTTQTVH